jgi:hypothetical protein
MLKTTTAEQFVTNPLLIRSICTMFINIAVWADLENASANRRR